MDKKSSILSHLQEKMKELRIKYEVSFKETLNHSDYNRHTTPLNKEKLECITKSFSHGKSNIIYNIWEQKLLENKRIADEYIKLLLENNPREEGYDFKNGILKSRPK